LKFNAANTSQNASTQNAPKHATSKGKFFFFWVGAVLPPRKIRIFPIHSGKDRPIPVPIPSWSLVILRCLVSTGLFFRSGDSPACAKTGNRLTFKLHIRIATLPSPPRSPRISTTVLIH